MVKIELDGRKVQQIVTEFYEKPMVGELMMMERSGMPRKMKVASLTQEVIRRNRNQTGGAPEELKNGHLGKFMLKLKLNILTQCFGSFNQNGKCCIHFTYTEQNTKYK